MTLHVRQVAGLCDLRVGQKEKTGDASTCAGVGVAHAVYNTNDIDAITLSVSMQGIHGATFVRTETSGCNPCCPPSAEIQ